MTLSLYARTLKSSGSSITDDEAGLGWLVPTDPSRPVHELQEQYQAQGYLWLKGILDRDEVLSFRRRFFETYAAEGLIQDGSDLVEGVYSGKAIPADFSQRLWMEPVRWPDYEAFCLSPRIIGFYERFLGGAVHLLKRKIIRYGLPESSHTTPGHYDLVYLRAGSDRVCSSWIPFGDTPVEMGGLIYLDGSDSLGRKMEAEFAARNLDLAPEERISAYNKNMAQGGWIGKDLKVLARMIGGRWLLANYEAGDMVVHSPYMIHASTENYNVHKRIRLSTDVRYQLVSERSDPRWNNDLHTDDNL